MGDAVLRALALACCYLGLAWFALVKPVHWRQVRGAVPLRRSVARQLRVLGSLALAGGLALALWVDHASMAPLVWVMSVTAASLCLTFTLAWRPRWLAVLVGWVRVPEP